MSFKIFQQLCLHWALYLSTFSPLLYFGLTYLYMKEKSLCMERLDNAAYLKDSNPFGEYLRESKAICDYKRKAREPSSSTRTFQCFKLCICPFSNWFSSALKCLYTFCGDS